MSIKNLEAFFNPRRIAVVGASEDPKSTGYFVLRNMIGRGFKGVVYPVNRSSESVQGVEAYRTISAVPHGIDLAILATPCEELPEALEECGRKGVKGVSILCPDFEARVRDSQALLSQIAKLSIKHAFRVLGP
ncbi:MAG TPA: CoA-binding protein, partial [Thermodesulfovibrionales bacterium]|nr:CoA-binding protein [Thermodesulfovibrionales bacterium]